MKTVFKVLIAMISITITANQEAFSEHYIIVHGTWAQHETWAKPGGDFFEYLWMSLYAKKNNSDSNTHHSALISIESFNWSGKNDHAERYKAAKKLAAIITTLPNTTKITLIAHSHGANVCFLASQLLANSEYSIQTLYALGAPIDSARYAPNMRIIKNLYNLFSFGDPIQTVSGCFERALPYHPQIHNIALTCNAQRPTHGELHAPLVARWLTTVPNLCNKQNIVHENFSPENGWAESSPTGSTSCLSSTLFGSLELFDNKPPLYYTDTKLPIYLENEKKLYAVLSSYMLPKTNKKRDKNFTPLSLF